MKCIRHHITKCLSIDWEDAQIKEIWQCGKFNGLDVLLNSCYLIQNPNNYDLPTINGTHQGDIVDECILYLLTNKLLNNVITYGYKIGKSTNVTSKLYCEYTNTSVSFLKSSNWSLLRKVIGTKNFIDILINFSLFYYNGIYFKQITGTMMNDPQKPQDWIKNPYLSRKVPDPKSTIDNRNMLYRMNFGFRIQKIIPSTTDDLFNEIFSDGGFVTYDPHFTIIISLFSKMISHHKKINYIKILHEICPVSDIKGGNLHLENQTKTKFVIRFIIVIIEKLYPIEIFGSKRNKSKYFKNISKLLNLKITGNLPFQTLTDGLRVKEIQWLGIERKKIHILDYKKRLQILHCFVDWFFKKFIQRLVSIFFYVTEVSSTIDVIYFRQDVWKNMSLPFLRMYFKENLYENTDCIHHNTFTYSKYNHKNLRLIPKKANNEFRVLATTFKGYDDNEMLDYENYLKQAVKPTQQILEYLRSKMVSSFKKLYSPAQIPTLLGEFKAKLLQKYDVLPILHCIKFDIASCYDSIPKKKGFEIIKRLLSEESQYVVRQRTVFQPRNNRMKKISVVNSSSKPQPGEIYIDNVNTFLLSREDVINVLKMELDSTCIKFNGKCYFRKHGLFQGSTLSATIVDIVYDDLLSNYPEFYPSDNSEDLILRLADDFLVISTNIDQIMDIKCLALNGFTKYGANINKTKMKILSSSQYNESNVRFCAIDIDLNTLDTWKSSETYNLMSCHSKSTKVLYKKLQRLFSIRLSYHTTDFKTNSWTTIIRHIANAAINIAMSFSKCFVGKIINHASFHTFIDTLVSISYDSCVLKDKQDSHKQELKILIAKCFYQALKRNKYWFNPAIEILDKIR